MNLLLKHNLKAGWRNILKYKTQNVISVLCLSVGVICFAITLYFVNAGLNGSIKNALTNRIIDISLWDDNTSYYPFESKHLEQIKQLESVKEIHYNRTMLGTDISLKVLKDDGGGIRNVENMMISVISPDWLKYHDFKSTITGKSIGTLKSGTLVMSERTRNQLFGKGVNPIGYELLSMTPTRRISDVVISPSYIGEFEGVFLVVDGTEEENYDLGFLEVILNDGYDQWQLKEDIERLHPQYNCSIHSMEEDVNMIAFVALIMLFLGASVLIIGLSGYLKMQLQLFTLRTREMALRKCNGAQPYQLFMLLCAEIFIIFLFTAATATGMTFVLAQYLMPILSYLGMTNSLYIDLDIIFNTELWISLFTFILSVGIAVFSVRRIIKAPLGKTAGRSYSSKTKWHSTIQVVQFFTATILLFGINCIYLSLNDSFKRYDIDNIDAFKKTVSFNIPLGGNDFTSQLPTLPSVDKTGVWTQKDWISREKPNPDISLREQTETYVVLPSGQDAINDKNYILRSIIIDPVILDIFGAKIVEHPKEDDTSLAPIYASIAEVERIKKAVHIEHEVPKRRYVLPDNNEYVRLGYVKLRPNVFVIDYYILSIDNYIDGQRPENLAGISTAYMLYPKNGDVNALQEDINRLCHELDPMIPADVDMTPLTLYQAQFRDLEMYRLLFQICTLLTIISIICIVLTVYSSVSLETRGRQKEVAIRKINGAKTRQIVMLFSRYYIMTLVIAFCLVLVAGTFLAIITTYISDSYPTDEETSVIILALLISIVSVAATTWFTIWHRIYQVAHVNAADMIKSE